MAKTADVYQSIWGDPWFVGLGVDEKLLYFWGITNEHSNLAGLYVVAGPLIQFETGLTPARFDKAVASLAEKGKMFFRPESGAVWVKGRTGRVRSKTPQIAKSIARAVEECPERDFKIAFLEKYGSNAWLSDALNDLALELESFEPHPNLAEVPSQGQSQSQGVGASNVVAVKEEPQPEGDVETVFAAWVDSKGPSNGRAPVLDRDRRKVIENALEMYPLEDVIAAVRGWRHSPHHRGENEQGKKYNSLKLCLRDPERIEEFRDLELSPPVRAMPGRSLSPAEKRANEIRQKREARAA